VAALAFVLFVVRQRRAEDPLVDLSLFRNPTFRSANAASFLTFTATVAVNFLVPFYLVGVLGRSQAEAGLIFLTVPLGLTLLAPVAGRLSDRVGSRGPTIGGLLLLIAGLVALARLGTSASTADVVWRLALVGAGNGLFQTPNNAALLGSAPRDRLGTASGLQAQMRNLGFAVGVALAGALVALRGGVLTDATLLRGLGLALGVSAALASVALLLCAVRTDGPAARTAQDKAAPRDAALPEPAVESSRTT
jgi:MFS family permease